MGSIYTFTKDRISTLVKINKIWCAGLFACITLTHIVFTLTKVSSSLFLWQALMRVSDLICNFLSRHLGILLLKTSQNIKYFSSSVFNFPCLQTRVRKITQIYSQFLSNYKYSVLRILVNSAYTLIIIIKSLLPNLYTMYYK